MKPPEVHRYHLPRWPLILAAFWAVCWMLLGVIIALLPIGPWKLLGAIPALWGGLNLRFKIAPKWAYSIVLNQQGFRLGDREYSWKELIALKLEKEVTITQARLTFQRGGNKQEIHVSTDLKDYDVFLRECFEHYTSAQIEKNVEFRGSQSELPE